MNLRCDFGIGELLEEGFGEDGGDRDDEEDEVFAGDVGEKLDAGAHAVQADHAAIHGEGFVDVRGAEHDPSDKHQDQGQRQGQHAGCRGLGPAGVAFNGQPCAMPCAPEHIGPVCAVPEAAEQHDEEQVQVGAKRALPVAAERNVEVVAQPGGEANMPALPELGDRLREVRHVEVCLKRKPIISARPIAMSE